MVDIHDPGKPSESLPNPLLRLGFRPFFLLAALFAVTAMVQWGLVYYGIYTFDPGPLTAFQWHAHEMIFGYTMAVIAGFLLTSVRNWTGRETPVGSPLAIMTAFWLLSRLAIAFGGDFVVMGILANLAFIVGFVWSIASRIFRVRQWRQAGILAVVTLLLLAEVTVLIGVVQKDQWLISRAIYAAFYLVVMLILIVGRRVTPFFIERGVGYPCTLRQSKVLDIAVVGAFALYIVVKLGDAAGRWAAMLAAVVFVAQGVRLINWHTAGIWKKPLLWSLFLALVFINIGFLMAALAPWISVSPYIVLHAFGMGGIGFITLSMMSRVSLGHTGRDVHHPPPIVSLSFVAMMLAIVSRVLLPWLWPASQIMWIGLSQVFWIAAFVLFLLQYVPILVAPRPDGRPGKCNGVGTEGQNKSVHGNGCYG